MRKTKIKKILGFSLLSLIFLYVQLVPLLAQEKYEEKFEKTESLARDGKVILSNISGSIRVKGWEREEVQIKALKICEDSSFSRAQEKAGAVTIEVTKTGNILNIETKYPEQRQFWRGESWNVSVNYELLVPDKASLEVKSISGDIDIESVGGSAKANSVSGSVEIINAGDGVDCNAVSGTITLRNIAGNAYLKTVSGDIRVTGIKGSVDAETVSGSVVLREVSEANSVRAKSISGDIRYEGKIHLQGRYSLKAHSGDVEVFLPADSAFDLEADTFSGDVQSDFSIEVSGKFSPRKIRGVVNKGGASLILSSFSGDIRLKKV